MHVVCCWRRLGQPRHRQLTVPEDRAFCNVCTTSSWCETSPMVRGRLRGGVETRISCCRRRRSAGCDEASLFLHPWLRHCLVLVAWMRRGQALEPRTELSASEGQSRRNADAGSPIYRCVVSGVSLEKHCTCCTATARHGVCQHNSASVAILARLFKFQHPRTRISCRVHFSPCLPTPRWTA